MDLGIDSLSFTSSKTKRKKESSSSSSILLSDEKEEQEWEKTSQERLNEKRKRWEVAEKFKATLFSIPVTRLDQARKRIQDLLQCLDEEKKASIDPLSSETKDKIHQAFDQQQQQSDTTAIGQQSTPTVISLTKKEALHDLTEKALQTYIAFQEHHHSTMKKATQEQMQKQVDQVIEEMTSEPTPQHERIAKMVVESKRCPSLGPSKDLTMMNMIERRQENMIHNDRVYQQYPQLMERHKIY